MIRVLFFIFTFFFSFSLLAADYSSVDERAKNVPVIYERNLKTLVRYLIEPYKGDDVLKTRAIYAWIASHVEYDMYKYNVIMGNKKSYRGVGDLKTGDAFKSRVGVCGDIADLFLRMAKAANLKVDLITGYAGYDLTMDNFKEARHAWNAVNIKGKWYFVDATWAMGGDYRTFENVRSHIEHRREIRRKKQKKENRINDLREINDRWFLVPPEKMIETHFPEREKQQYSNRPVDMKKVFRENARKLKRKKK